MHHLVFIIHKGFIAYRMNDQQGSHPLGDDNPQDVIDYLKTIIKFKTFEIINHYKTRVTLHHDIPIHSDTHHIIHSYRFSQFRILCYCDSHVVSDTQLRIKKLD